MFAVGFELWQSYEISKRKKRIWDSCDNSKEGRFALRGPSS
jgi:hypothetical protein